MIEVGQKVVVTTEFRGVFFGTLAEYDKQERTVTLTQGRNCLSWPSSNRGFLGLASDGPRDGAKVGPEVDTLDLARVTSVTLCSEEAVARWEAGPWS